MRNIKKICVCILCLLGIAFTPLFMIGSFLGMVAAATTVFAEQESPSIAKVTEFEKEQIDESQEMPNDTDDQAKLDRIYASRIKNAEEYIIAGNDKDAREILYITIAENDYLIFNDDKNLKHILNFWIESDKKLMETLKPKRRDMTYWSANNYKDRKERFASAKYYSVHGVPGSDEVDNIDKKYHLLAQSILTQRSIVDKIPLDVRLNNNNHDFFINYVSSLNSIDSNLDDQRQAYISYDLISPLCAFMKAKSYYSEKNTKVWGMLGHDEEVFKDVVKVLNDHNFGKYICQTNSTVYQQFREAIQYMEEVAFTKNEIKSLQLVDSRSPKDSWRKK